MKHTHKWEITGTVVYTCPLKRQYKCKCGETKWIEDSTTGIEHRKMTEEQLRKKYPQMFRS